MADASVGGYGPCIGDRVSRPGQQVGEADGRPQGPRQYADGQVEGAGGLPKQAVLVDLGVYGVYSSDSASTVSAIALCPPVSSTRPSSRRVAV